MLTTPIGEHDGKKIYMTDELIRANLTTILSAGHSTTTAMLSWTLNYLYDWSLGNSDYLYKLVQEVDSVSKGDRSYQPTVDDVYKKMPFLTHVLYETLRMCPSIPTIVRHCIKTCNVGGYLIKRGSPIMISTLGTHMNPKSWDDPWTYNPERWDDGPKKACSFIAWASGPRQCIGREFAMLTGRLALFSIINQFALELSPKANVEANEHLFVFPKGLWLKKRERANLKPAVMSDNGNDKSDKKDKKDKKESNSDDDTPASDGKRNWAGLMNLIQEEGYRTIVVEGTNSESGNVSKVTGWLIDKAVKFSFKTKESPISFDELLDEVKESKPDKFVIWGLVTATYNGKPPNNASKFHKWLKKKVDEGDDKYLENVHYFVFGCGNTNWSTTYQKMPTFFDESLEKLGATRIAEMAEFDESQDELEEVFGEYYKTMAPALMHSLPKIGDTKLRKVNKKYGGSNAKVEDDDDEDFSKESKLEAQPSSSAIELEVLGDSDKNDCDFIPSAIVSSDEYKKCKVKKVKNITPDSERGTLHVEIEMADGMEYKAGDHLVVLPRIPTEYAKRVLEQFKDYDLDTVVKFNCQNEKSKKRFKLPTDTPCTVENILCSLVDLKVKPSKQFIINYSTIVEDEEQAKKLEKIANDKETHAEWIKNHEPLSVVDIIEKYPPKQDFGRLLEIMPILQTRTYSITSSPNVQKNEIHVCAGLVHDKFENGTYDGVCSGYFDNLKDSENSDIYAYIEPASDSFRVPEDTDKPIILISAGTGFAPMRAFLHERSAQKAKGKNIVFFGCRTEDNDILFKDELDEWKESDFIESYFAFSRSDKHDKKYIQDVITENKDYVWELIDEKKAIIYVCGSGSRMGKGVRDAFLEMFKEHCPDDEDKDEYANNYLEKLDEDDRYELDVWG